MGKEASQVLEGIMGPGWREAARERARAREEWEKANPEIAAAWNEANAENRSREQSRELDAQQEAERAKLEDHLIACGVGGRTAKLIALGGLENTPALAAIPEWLSGDATFLLLLGKAGTGKSVAAACVLENAKVYQKGCDGKERWRYSARDGLFVKAHELVRSMHGDGELLDRAYRVGWLVLDELGSEYADQAGRWLAELDALLDARYEARALTVITTNLPAEEFKSRYGERIASRIRGDGLIADCGAEDLRRGGRPA